jgi:Xaa-Pro aminopeptidase
MHMMSNRHDVIRQFLRTSGLGAWLAWRADELVMMSGHLPYWGVSVLLFPCEGRPTLFVPALEPRDHLPGDAQIVEYPWGRMDCSDPFAVLQECMRRTLGELRLDQAPLGFVPAIERSSPTILSGEAAPFPPRLADEFARLTSAGWQDATAGFLDLYLRKTDEEIRAIRLANRIANRGIDAFFANLVAGRTEAEVAAAVESVIHTSIGRDGAHFARGWALVQSGPNSADGGRFNRSTGRSLQEGDLVMMELATCVNGYWSDLTRSGGVGTLSSTLQAVLDAVREAQAAAIAAVRGGVPAADIDRRARDVVARRGFTPYFQHATGHHVGFRYHDPGFAIAPHVQAVLEPGMIITIEPGIYGHELGGGARVEDNILVTASGYEVLSHD